MDLIKPSLKIQSLATNCYGDLASDSELLGVNQAIQSKETLPFKILVVAATILQTVTLESFF